MLPARLAKALISREFQALRFDSVLLVLPCLWQLVCHVELCLLIDNCLETGQMESAFHTEHTECEGGLEKT